MGVFAVLMSLSLIPLGNLIPKASTDSVIATFMVDLRSQQLKAMLGAMGPTGMAAPYGIHLDTQEYSLFYGSTYSASESDNVGIPTDEILISSNLPTDNLVFEQGSGEVLGLGDSIYTITFTNSINSQTADLSLNKYGVVTHVEK